MKRILNAALAALALCLALALSPAAAAKSYTLQGAEVEVTLLPDGSLRVQEQITFQFSGDFTGAYRDVAVREGQEVTEIAVSEGGTDYRPGASAELGSSGSPGTFGTERLGSAMRIVWHYVASDELRSFDVSYRLSGVAEAYDDVVDVNLKVWGDEWPVPLHALEASLELPLGERVAPVRIYAHPAHVRGSVARGSGSMARLSARDIPAGQFVELRVLYPRSVLTSTAGARVRQGRGLERIERDERRDAHAYDRDRRRIRSALDHLPEILLLLLGLASIPAAALIAATHLLYGRERATSYDREYEQEPPSELEPALVPPLLRQRAESGSREFTATLFDLIRRGRYTAKPVTSERKVWGGLRHEQVADLELAPGAQIAEPASFERDVIEVVDSVLADGPERLSSFRDRIEADRTANAKRFESFKEHVTKAIEARRWFESRGLVPIVLGIAGFALLAAILLFLGIQGFRALAPRFGDIVLIALGICAAVNAVTCLLAAFAVRLWRRRRPAAQAEAERWEAFRSYLTDFPRLQEAPPASLELWERFLVYGIAFGIAERVLQGAHLHMPEKLHEASSVYWISPSGDLGSGPSALSIADLSSGFGSALSPPSSGSGGGFSGGGGSGGGGGGGGAW